MDKTKDKVKIKLFSAFGLSILFYILNQFIFYSDWTLLLLFISTVAVLIYGIKTKERVLGIVLIIISILIFLHSATPALMGFYSGFTGT
ncbi:hypothetical protein HYX17_03565 [Candidatus Woesearchaeota archaeon]|nr:hypothetical protein [Candidatus Woesearchaeota archaeon]